MKKGLVLAGGGSRGAYQIGVWQALRELDFQIQAVAGTSVGALNAAMVAQDDFEGALALWERLTTGDVLASAEGGGRAVREVKALRAGMLGGGRRHPPPRPGPPGAGRGKNPAQPHGFWPGDRPVPRL